MTRKKQAAKQADPSAVCPPVDIFAGQPWLITRDALEALQAGVFGKSPIDPFVEADGMAGINPAPTGGDGAGDMAGVFVLNSRKDPADAYMVKDGFGIIPVRGSMTAEPSYWSGASYAGVLSAARAADTDPKVERILIDMMSPGGTVMGAFEGAAGLKKLSKPLYVYANGQMTSGALLIGSAAKMIGSPKTAQIGSIGVITAHVDESKLDERVGIKVTYLTAGKYKAYGNPSEPLSSDAREYIQDRLNQLYSMFVDLVAENRNMTTEAVLLAADGKIFLAPSALDAGLIDAIVSDMDDFMQLIKNKEDESMDVNELKTKHPDLVKALSDEAVQEAAKAVPGQIQEACAKACANIMGIVRAVAGEETAAKVEKITAAGLTAEQLAAVAGIINAAPAQSPVPAADPKAGDAKAKILEGLQASGNQPVNAAPTDQAPVSFEAALVAYMKDNPKVKKSEAIMAVRKQNPEAYEKWIADHQK